MTDINDLSRTLDVKRLPDSAHPSSRRPRRRLLFVLATAGLLALTASPALAGGGTSTQVNSAIKANAKGDTVGFGGFTRTRYESSQKLKVNVFVEKGMVESNICLSDRPFTRRVAPGACQHDNQTPSQTHTYTIDLAEAEGPVYVQAHVVTSEDETAFAGWQAGAAGSPFYGNLEIADPAGEGTPVPIGAVGALLLTGAVAGGLALRGARR